MVLVWYGLGMRKETTKKFLTGCLVSLVLSYFITFVPGTAVGWFCILGAIALIPIVAGPRLYRVLGVIALVFAIWMAVDDYKAGQRMEERMEQIRAKYREDVTAE